MVGPSRPFPRAQAKECMLFAGTGIASGACIGVVNSIGMETEIGKIQEQIQVGRILRAQFAAGLCSSASRCMLRLASSSCPPLMECHSVLSRRRLAKRRATRR